MTTEQINRAMAELEDVYICASCNHQIDPTCCHCGDPMQGHGYDQGHSAIPLGCTCGYCDADKMRSDCPDCDDYCHDLNAVNRVEERLFIAESQWAKYGYQLQETIRRYAVGVVPYYERDLASIGKLAHATALQRCEAILRVMGKWEESQ